MFIRRTLMKKNELKKLALMGLTGGLLFTMHTEASAQGYWWQQSTRSSYQQEESGNQRMMQQKQQRQQRQHQNNMENSPSRTEQMTEQELLSQLNQQGRALYQSLDPKGKTLTLQLANQTCEGQNKCEGLNSCESDENGCSGEGGCKGQSPGPFKDKNQAVEVAAKHLAQERQEASKNMLNNGMDRIPKNRTNQKKSWLRRSL